jgi:hypothetical protein
MTIKVPAFFEEKLENFYRRRTRRSTHRAPWLEGAQSRPCGPKARTPRQVHAEGLIIDRIMRESVGSAGPPQFPIA